MVLSPRRWGQVRRDDLRATVANKPDTPGRARSSRNTIAQGVPSDFGVPVLACVRLFCLHAWQWVRACTRHSLRPLFSGGHGFSHNPGAIRAAGMRRCVFVIAKSVARVSGATPGDPHIAAFMRATRLARNDGGATAI